ncbi:RDD family protein [Streptomyces sp. B6B3]|uniref:RDD family protein n=1 Tax=Streptomyces sp. B6B3 TaxID=3153570 RepID=UPI00325E7E1F
MSYSWEEPPGGRWRRVGARCLDGFVAVLPAVPLAFAVGPILQRALLRQALRLRSSAVLAGGTEELGDLARQSLTDIGQTLGAVVLGFLAVILISACLYDWLAHALVGRTLGKWVFGIAVVRSRDGGRPGVLRSLLRTALLIGLPGTLVCVTWADALASETGQAQPPFALRVLGWAYLGCLLLILTPLRRGHHELLSTTRVVATR